MYCMSFDVSYNCNEYFLFFLLALWSKEEWLRFSVGVRHQLIIPGRHPTSALTHQQDLQGEYS